MACADDDYRGTILRVSERYLLIAGGNSKYENPVQHQKSITQPFSTDQSRVGCENQ